MQDRHQKPYDWSVATMRIYTVHERCWSLAKARTTFTGGVRAVWRGVVPSGDVALPGRKLQSRCQQYIVESTSKLCQMKVICT